ncbi:MAG: zinc dependent phospholipase C family protein [Dehalococcoidia bacterium]|nr:zinc dependent phospholipase C family protein [Dehalococcoidia bacterium]MDW8119612.1 zinc dependent phospholipase C family protein [Chloroflexota bacterium]
MPNLTYHLALAWECAQGFPHPLVHRHLGVFLLGATAPDIRAMTRAPREETHFAPLSSQEVTAGITGLFQVYPHLRYPTALDEATQAFLLGYFSHLIADMAWVVHIFRPFFGNTTLFPIPEEGQVLDRALQLSLDQQVHPQVQPLLPLLDGSEGQVHLPFLPAQDLGRWRSIVQEVCGRPFAWERLRNFTRRLFPHGNPLAHHIAEAFLRDPQAGLASLWARVSPQEVARFAQACQRTWAQKAEEWLACAS